MNTTGFMMECLNNTEIVIHDAGNSLMSFMYYTGNTFRIGRNMGYGNGNLYVTGFLRCDTYLYTSGTMQSFNSYYFPINLWNYDNDGQTRFYLASQNTSYWCGNFQAT